MTTSLTIFQRLSEAECLQILDSGCLSVASALHQQVTLRNLHHLTLPLFSHL
jgi:hypothetical protein